MSKFERNRLVVRLAYFFANIHKIYVSRKPFQNLFFPKKQKNQQIFTADFFVFISTTYFPNKPKIVVKPLKTLVAVEVETLLPLPAEVMPPRLSPIRVLIIVPTLLVLNLF